MLASSSVLSGHARTSLVLTSLLFAAGARANGAFPEVSQLLSDPSDATHLVLRSNFGLLSTRDTGQNWDLVCEGGIGYQNIEPAVALLGDGSLIAALSSGIAHGDPSACNFGRATGVSAYVADVSRVPGTSASAVAVSVDPSASSSQVWQSNDGSTWATLGSTLPDLSAVTLDVAADDASIVYVSGTTQSAARSGVLARSADGGHAWARYAVPGTSRVSAPYIAAISASDHQLVYVRLSGAPGRLLVTRDGGEHFDSALDFTGPFDGFALSPDGQFALASGRIDGVWRAPTSTLVFERLSCAKIRCLSWSGSGLFACADEFEAGFLVGQSADDGGSFAPVLHLSCLRGPLSCAPSSTVGAVCAQAWPGISEQLGSDCAAASSFMPSTQCRDAGSGPSDATVPGSDASPTSDGGPPGPHVTPIPSAALSARGGCACNAARASSEPWPWLSVLALGWCCSRRSARKARAFSARSA